MANRSESQGSTDDTAVAVVAATLDEVDHSRMPTWTVAQIAVDALRSERPHELVQ